MIRSLHLQNFKNFEDEKFHFGPFSLIAGENATGKSNLGDALRILHGIAARFDLDSVLRGVQRPIRSGADTATLSAEFVTPNHKRIHYVIGFSATEADEGAFRVVREELRGEGKVIVTRSRTEAGVIAPNEEMPAPAYVRRKSGNLEPMDIRIASLTALFGSALVPDVPEVPPGYILSLRQMLRRIRCLAFGMPDLRTPGAQGAKSLQSSGREFSSVLKAVCQDPKKRDAVIAWLRELTPTDIRGVRFFDDPDGRVHLEVHEGSGRHFGLRDVSDGTLRFLAVMTAILGAREHPTCFLDDVETGLHPSRIWLLMRFIEEHVGRDDLQVIATTHSPEVLDRMNDRTFRDSTVLANIQGHPSSSAHRIAGLPKAAVLRESHGLGRLLRNGWMEDVLYFEDDREPEPVLAAAE